MSLKIDPAFKPWLVTGWREEGQIQQYYVVVPKETAHMPHDFRRMMLGSDEKWHEIVRDGGLACNGLRLEIIEHQEEIEPWQDTQMHVHYVKLRVREVGL